MSSLCRQSTISPQPQSTEELNSELFWIDGTIDSLFHEETFRLFEGAATTLDGPPAVHAVHPPSFEGDHFGLPPAQSGDGQRAEFAGFTTDVFNVPLNVQPEDFFDPAYQVTYGELFYDDYNTCVPSDIAALYQESPPVSTTTSTHTLSTSVTDLPTAPANPSTMSGYAPCFDYTPQALPSDNITITSPPPASPSVSSHCFDSSESDCDGDDAPPSDDDDDDEYHPTQSTSYQKQEKRKSTFKSLRPVVLSPACFTSSEPGKISNSSRDAAGRTHPYRHDVPPRNFQCEDSALFVDKGSNFKCPLIGCDHIQGNQRIPDLKRHIATHVRRRQPEKWICCGVSMGKAHLYGKSIKEGLSHEECIEAGAYMFAGQLMIGGCLGTFSRRDALKRHVDNPNLPCVGPWTPITPSSLGHQG